MLLLPIGFMAQPTVVAAAPLLLDGVGIAIACSVRALRSDYAGPALRVRRSSDNAELDIGFKSGLLDTAALLAFCGPADGFVPKWYSQDPSGHHPTQAVAANQPRIVKAGVVETQGGQPCVSCIGGAMWLNVPAGAFAGCSSSTAICTFRGQGNGGWWTIGSGTPNTHTPYANAAYEQYLATSRPSFGPYAAPDSPVVHTAHNDGASLAVFRCGAQVGSAQATTFTNTPAYVGNSSGYSEVALSEVVLTTRALSGAGRQTIERSMGAFYAISVA